DLVCYGHTHQALERFEGATHVLNPGAVYRAKPHSVAVVRLPELTVEFLTF
ncbi:MAG: metallophosphoesterase family protein, partial [Pirellulaceae bacterium]